MTKCHKQNKISALQGFACRKYVYGTFLHAINATMSLSALLPLAPISSGMPLPKARLHFFQ